MLHSVLHDTLKRVSCATNMCFMPHKRGMFNREHTHNTPKYTKTVHIL